MNYAKKRSGFIIIMLFIRVANCASLPASESNQEIYRVLPPQASFYAAMELSDMSKKLVIDLFSVVQSEANLQSNTEQNDADNTSTGFIINRTEKIYMTFLPKPVPEADSTRDEEEISRQEGEETGSEESVSYYILLLGNYPLFPINFNLSAQEKWERMELGRACWFNNGSGAMMCLPENSLILYTNADMEQLWSRYEQRGKLEPAAAFVRIEKIVQRELAENRNKGNPDFRPAEFVLYFPYFSADNYTRYLNDEQQGIRELLVIGNRSGAAYELQLSLSLQNEEALAYYAEKVKAYIVALMQASRLANSEEIGRELVVHPEGTELTVAGLRLVPEEIIQLITSLLDGE